METREYNRKWRQEHPLYWKEYYKDHKKEILKNNAKWRENNKADVIYFHISEDGRILYIGSSGQRAVVERQSAHLTGNSNLKMTVEEYIEKYRFSTIMYKDLTRFNLSRHDLYFLESYFKKNHVQVLDGNNVKYKEDELTRSEDELIRIAEQEEYKLFNFDLEKYLN